MTPAPIIREIQNTILLFDMDGTLTKHRQPIEPEMLEFLMNDVRLKVPVGLVSGSDFEKVSYQLGGQKVISKLDYVFCENGLDAYQNGKLLGTESIQEHIGEEKVQKLLNYCLAYMSRLELPVKRGTFIEFRNGMINICPVGRSCSPKERAQFVEFDKVHKIRDKFLHDLKKEFSTYGLKFCIAGQLSIDIFPIGWDKTSCLKYLSKYSVLHFFGDGTHPGGNDYELYESNRTIGHHVQCPEDTMEQVIKLLETLSPSSS